MITLRDRLIDHVTSRACEGLGIDQEVGSRLIIHPQNLVAVRPEVGVSSHKPVA